MRTKSSRDYQDVLLLLKSSKPSLMKKLLVQVKQVSKNSRYSMFVQELWLLPIHCSSETSARQKLLKQGKIFKFLEELSEVNIQFQS